MAKVSFEEAVEANTIEVDKAVAVRPDTQVAIVGEQSKYGIYGEVTQEDLRLPRLNLVNKTGDLSNQFTPGSFVIDKEHQITTVEKGVAGILKVIPVRVKVEYQEALEYNPEVRPRVFDTAEEVRKNGGRVTWGRGEGIFSKVGHLELLIEKPEKLSEEAGSSFFYIFGEKEYARVMYTTSITAYATSASVLLNDKVQGHLRGKDYIAGYYTLGAKTASNAKGTWWIPDMKTAGLVPDKIQDEIRGLI